MPPSATTFLSLLALSISFQLSESASLRGGWLPNAQKIDCSKELELRITCTENCDVMPSDSPALEQRFQIDLITKTDKLWELKEATMAAGSITRPFEFLPLSTDLPGREVAPTRPISLQWSIQSNDLLWEQAILLATATAITASGDECHIQATYPTSSDEEIPADTQSRKAKQPKWLPPPPKEVFPDDDESNSGCLEKGTICWDSPVAPRLPCNTCCNGYKSAVDWTGTCL